MEKGITSALAEPAAAVPRSIHPRLATVANPTARGDDRHRRSHQRATESGDEDADPGRDQQVASERAALGTFRRRRPMRRGRLASHREQERRKQHDRRRDVQWFVEADHQEVEQRRKLDQPGEQIRGAQTRRPYAASGHAGVQHVDGDHDSAGPKDCRRADAGEDHADADERTSAPGGTRSWVQRNATKGRRWWCGRLCGLDGSGTSRGRRRSAPRVSPARWRQCRPTPSSRRRYRIRSGSAAQRVRR